MNLYCLVEGKRTEKKVYRSWIPQVFPELSEVNRIEDIKSNNFFLLSGNGYPSYRSRVISALKDIDRCNKFDRFMICVDAEQVSVEEKIQELNQLIAQGIYFQESHIIVHNCCIETWFLGHTRMLRRNPHSKKLRDFKAFYNVSENDPEEMTCPSEYKLRAPFHVMYLKEMLRERGLSYTKSNPRVVQEREYFEALVERNTQSGHLTTFGNLLHIWRSWGANI